MKKKLGLAVMCTMLLATSVYAYEENVEITTDVVSETTEMAPEEKMNIYGDYYVIPNGWVSIGSDTNNTGKMDQVIVTNVASPNGQSLKVEVVSGGTVLGSSTVSQGYSYACDIPAGAAYTVNVQAVGSAGTYTIRSTTEAN